MKIALLGSWREADFQKNNLTGTFGEYKEFCRKLGESLAKFQHEIIVGNYYEIEKIKAITAETSLIDGYLAYAESEKLEIDNKILGIHPHGKFKRFRDVRKKNEAAFYFFEQITHKDWGSIHLEIAKLCDIMILIGGGGLTNNAGYTCYNLKKSLLIPIPSFGGAGKYQLDLLKIDPNARNYCLIIENLLDFLENQDFDGFIQALGKDPQKELSDPVLESIQQQYKELLKLMSLSLMINEGFPNLQELLYENLRKIGKIQEMDQNKLKEKDKRLLESVSKILEMVAAIEQAQEYDIALKAGKSNFYIKVNKWMKEHPNIIKLLKNTKKVTNFVIDIAKPIGTLVEMLTPL